MKTRLFLSSILPAPMTLEALAEMHGLLKEASDVSGRALAYLELCKWRDRFAKFGLTGRFRFSESTETEELYALTFEALDLPPGRQEAFEKEFTESGWRELADTLTTSGQGEFFSVEGTFESFEWQFILPLLQGLQPFGLQVPDAKK